MLAYRYRQSGAPPAGSPLVKDPFMKRLRIQLLLSTGVLIVTTLGAAQTRDGVMTINGGRKTVMVKPQQTPVVPAAPAASNLITIYSNLSTPDHAYNSIAGAGI